MFYEVFTNTFNGVAAGNPGAVGETGRRITTAPPAPRARVPDPQVLLLSRAGPSSMFVNGEVQSVAQERPSLQDAIQIEEPVIIEDMDEAKYVPPFFHSHVDPLHLQSQI
jgi:hypothetical protein